MAKDFTKVLKGAQPKPEQKVEEPKAKPSVFYGGPFNVELIGDTYTIVFEDTEELRDLQDKDIIIKTPEYTQEELKKMYEDQEAKKLPQDINTIIEETHARIYPDATEKLKTIKGDIKGSFTFKASKEVLDDLRALATIKHTTQAELIEEALINYYKDNLADYELALKLRKEFNL